MAELVNYPIVESSIPHLTLGTCLPCQGIIEIMFNLLYLLPKHTFPSLFHLSLLYPPKKMDPMRR